MMIEKEGSLSSSSSECNKEEVCRVHWCFTGSLSVVADGAGLPDGG